MQSVRDFSLLPAHTLFDEYIMPSTEIFFLFQQNGIAEESIILIISSTNDQFYFIVYRLCVQRPC